MSTLHLHKFQDHVDKYVCKDIPNYEEVISLLEKFACLEEEDRFKRFPKLGFPSVDHVPPCLKYSAPTSLKFIENPPLFCDKGVAVIEVDIQNLINVDPDHFLDLHPVRYDKVKEAISKGEIDMPFVSLCPEGIPRVGNGRHRIISLYKFGINTIKIVVPEPEANEIAHLLLMATDKPQIQHQFSVRNEVFPLSSYFK